MNKYVQVGGWYSDDDHYKADRDRNRLFLQHNAKEIFPFEHFVVNVADHGMGYWHRNSQSITVPNLGHVVQMRNDGIDGYCGWSVSVMMGILYAYHHHADMLYIEQDCLVFGEGWIDYFQSHPAKLIVGLGPHPTYVEQSLFYLKYEYLLPFLLRWLAIPEQDRELVPEQKWMRLMNETPNLIQQMPYGYGRRRPYNSNDERWYIQQVTNDELADLVEWGLV